MDFLLDQGFLRRVCKSCGKGFWTLDPQREVCSDQPCSYYEFLGNPPTNKRYDYLEAWKAIDDYFVRNGHTSIRRYPTICRWYPLFFTAAGIIDFYRLDDGNVVFDMPFNPVFVNQPCLRFNDIPNVGITGRHYTSFTMVQQSSSFDGKQGYWKDRCIELDYNLLKSVFGIPSEEIVFIESVWVGPGAFGSSLEYFVRGLELGNAVFTEFLQTDSGIQEMSEKIIDMGAGLHRFPWITQGTPTSYDITFEPVLETLWRETGIEYDESLFLEYSRLAGALNFDEVEDIDAVRRGIARELGMTEERLQAEIASLQALYSLCDHTKALTFAISDGALPSNVGGGYNLRVVLRRALNFIDRFGWDFDLIDICELHAKHLKPVCPELMEHLEEIDKILEIETKRFYETKKRTRRLVERIARTKRRIDTETLVQLYDSQGVTPELVKEYNPDLKVPGDFYVRVTERHEREEKEKEIDKARVPLEGLPPTIKLFYDDQTIRFFEGEVLRIFDHYVVLDRTAFYPTSGGQDHDSGRLNGCQVVDVGKVGDLIVHKMKRINFKKGDTVQGVVDEERRDVLTKHHTATHIVNASARKILGSWVWQAGSEKTVEKARLDITHYEALSRERIKRIEEYANKIVEENIPVIVKWMSRNEAEKEHGFRIYQGGAVPSKNLRIIEIPNVDVEACGGLQRKSTGEVGFITILNAERIQDGVVRLEYTCGENAVRILKEKEELVNDLKELLKVSDEEIPLRVEELLDIRKEKGKKLDELRNEIAEEMSEELIHEFVVKRGLKVLVKTVEGLEPDELKEMDHKLSREDTLIFLFGSSDKIYVYCRGGEASVKKGIDVGEICRGICTILGGKGGGSKTIGEGFGLRKDKLKEAEGYVLSKVLKR